MAVELDNPPQLNTMKFFTWATVKGIAWARSFFGRRLTGAAIGLMSDLLAEGAEQAFYARLPGHPEQAEDSLAACAKDRDLVRFRGETNEAWLQRIKDVWSDYEQGGTPQQVLKVVNEWGQASFAGFWDSNLVTLTESGDPEVWEFTIEIPYGLIIPEWTPEVYGSGHIYGEVGFYYGLSSETDLAMLRYIVRKWKRSASVGKIKIFYSPTESVTTIV